MNKGVYCDRMTSPATRLLQVACSTWGIPASGHNARASSALPPLLKDPARALDILCFLPQNCIHARHHTRTPASRGSRVNLDGDGDKRSSGTGSFMHARATTT